LLQGIKLIVIQTDTVLLQSKRNIFTELTGELEKSVLSNPQSD